MDFVSVCEGNDKTASNYFRSFKKKFTYQWTHVFGREFVAAYAASGSYGYS